MNLNFELLKPNEIEVRVQKIYADWVSCLLYIKARCVMNKLDKMFGPMNWQRKHYECCGSSYCSIGIRTETGEWIWKDDVGEKTQLSAEKGESSDSFKRAAVNWGIGRELYTSPQIFIPAKLLDIRTNEKGKKTVRSTLTVKRITYDQNRHIESLILVREPERDKPSATVFSWNDYKTRIIGEAR